MTGQRDRDSAKQRQKEQYREELQRQMRETQEARRRLDVSFFHTA